MLISDAFIGFSPDLASCALQWLHYATHNQTKDTIRDVNWLESDWLCEPIPKRPHFTWIRKLLGSFWLDKPYLIEDWYRVSTKRLRKSAQVMFGGHLAGNQQVTNIPLDRVESVEIVFRIGDKIFAVFFDFVHLVTKWCIWLTLNFHRISLRGGILWFKWDRQNIP